MRKGLSGEGEGLALILRLGDKEEQIRKRLPITRIDTRDENDPGGNECSCMQLEKLATHT